MEDVTLTDVLSVMATIRQGRNLSMSLYRADSQSMAIGTNSAGTVFMFRPNQGDILIADGKGASVASIAESCEAFLEGRPDWGDGLPWQRPDHLLQKPVLCVGATFYVPRWDAGFDKVTKKEQLRLLWRVIRNEVVIFLVLAGAATCGIAAAAGRGRTDWTAVSVMAVICAVASALHYVNWRCPLCGKRMGVLKARCLCGSMSSRKPKRAPSRK